MSRCRGDKKDTPQISWFVDPIGIFKSFARGNFAMTAAVAFLPRLGLDGLSGAGGNMFFDTEAFEFVHHVHVLLENPRTGVLAAVALKSGDLTPPTWVPADVTTYMAANWDARQTFEQVAKLIDSFRGKDFTRTTALEEMHRAIDVEFEKDILDNLQAGVFYISWFDRPVRLDSQAPTRGDPVEGPESGTGSRGQGDGQGPPRDAPVKKELAGVTYYEVPVRQSRRRTVNPDGTISEEKSKRDSAVRGAVPMFRHRWRQPDLQR